MKRLLVGAAVAALSGCYSYVPVDVAAAPTTDRVAFDLTARGSVNYEALLGPEVIRVEGQTVAVRPDSVTLALLGTRNRAGLWTPWNREQVTIDRGSIAMARERKFSKLRTFIASAAVVGVIVVTAATDLIGMGDDGRGDGPGDRPNPGGQ